jgi:hypothetical protein
MMSLDELEERFVNEMSQFTEQRLGRVIQRLDERSYDFWTKKLWDAQDIEPYADDEYASYNRSIPVMIVLKRSLLLRLPVEEDQSRRRRLQQQLSLLSLVLNPDAVAEVTGLPLDGGTQS